MIIQEKKISRCRGIETEENSASPRAWRFFQNWSEVSVVREIER